MLTYTSKQIHQHFLLKFCKRFPYVSHDNTPHGQLNGHDPLVYQQVCSRAYLFPSINQEYTFFKRPQYSFYSLPLPFQESTLGV